MKKTVNLGVYLAAFGIICRLLIYKLGGDDDSSRWYAVATYLFLLCIASVGSIWMSQLPSQSAFLLLFKQSLRATVIFGFTVAAFSYVNYAFFDVQYLPSKVEERKEAAQNFDYLKDLPESHPARNLSREEFVAKEVDMAATIYNPFSYATFTLVLFLIASLIYSISFALMWRIFPNLLPNTKSGH